MEQIFQATLTLGTMAVTVRGVEYFYTTVEDRPGEAYGLLSHLAEAGVNLLAFSAIPFGPEHTQLVLFPENTSLLTDVAQKASLTLTGPQCAFLVQGDDRLGAFADIHRMLSDAQVNVYASSGVTDSRGGFGYVLYVRPEDYRKAAAVLGAGAE
jgi:predicted amino acid-binding ACT domain protein